MTSSNSVKVFVLVVLTLQMSVTVLGLRYSRMHEASDDDEAGGRPVMYIVSTSILCMEAMKMSFVIVMLWVQLGCSFTEVVRTVNKQIVQAPRETSRLVVPAFLYVIQDNLIVYALSCLDAATYQTTYQIRILTTAVFSMLLLGKQITKGKWVALLLLLFGVIVVQRKSDSVGHGKHSHEGDQLSGLVAVLLATMTSGFAGVYNEKVLKDGGTLLFIRNIQLGMFCIPFAAMGVLIRDLAPVRSMGFFFGYKPIVWVIILLQACGGLIVAAAMKYADNIWKNFATSISIVLNCILSHFLLHDTELTLTFMFGTVLIIGSTFLYGYLSLATVAKPEAFKVFVEKKRVTLPGDEELLLP